VGRPCRIHGSLVIFAVFCSKTAKEGVNMEVRDMDRSILKWILKECVQNVTIGLACFRKLTVMRLYAAF
jgi:hypothetical protein